MTAGEVGLCSSCVHSRRITSGKGGTFWLCRLAERDPSFPKYPILPVLRCRGYEPAGAGEPDRSPD
ncbi:MAG TPA: hypothetical protein VGQ73_03670 [Gemmatimonadales bacterium]|jgi:hypothetical protein|nr:hypothetical protein [Gemmatimonadales bacterium]